MAIQGYPSSTFLTSAIFAVIPGLAAALVDCGGHYEAECSACPHEFGAVWCNGECAWVDSPIGGHCMPAPQLPGLTMPRLGLQSGWSLFYQWCVLFAATGVIYFIFAMIYFSRIIVGPPKMEPIGIVLARGARRGVFDCFKHPDTCLYTALCLPFVQAKNMYATRILPFWPGCCLSYVFMFSPLYLIAILVRTMVSTRIQTKMGFENNVCENLIFSTFCMPCDIGRESLEVDAELGADITCCFDVKYVPRVINEFDNLIDNTAEKISRSCGRATCSGH